MSTLSSIAIICLILLAWNRMTDGLACYSCTNCNDPFNQNYVLIRYGNESTVTPIYCIKTTVGYNTTRDLVTTCSPYGTAGNGVWCCQTNLCNGAKRNMLPNAFSFGVVTLMLISFV